MWANWVSFVLSLTLFQAGRVREGGGGGRAESARTDLRRLQLSKAAGDKLLMNTFIRQNFGGGLTLNSLIS